MTGKDIRASLAFRFQLGYEGLVVGKIYPLILSKCGMKAV